MKALDRAKIKDGVTEAVCESLREAVREIQGLPGLVRDVIKNVRLNGTLFAATTNVPHRLGRKPQMVRVSVPRVAPADLASLTAGVIVDAGTADLATGAPIERERVIQLGAQGFGVNIIVDVEVS